MRPSLASFLVLLAAAVILTEGASGFANAASNLDPCSARPTPVKQAACRINDTLRAVRLALCHKTKHGRLLFGSTQMKIGVALESRTNACGKGRHPALKSYAVGSAIVAMNYVQQRVSHARHYIHAGRQSEVFAELRRLPGSQRPNNNLRAGIGLCGNQLETFFAIMTELNVKTRAVQFWYQDANGRRASHIGAEVLDETDKSWKFFDITWGTYFAGGAGFWGSKN